MAQSAEAVVGLGQQRLEAGGIAVRLSSPRMAASVAPGSVPRHQLAGLPAFEVAHPDRVAGLDVDEHRAIAVYQVALHSGRQCHLRRAAGSRSAVVGRK